MTTASKPTISFWIVSSLALFWNFMGVLSFVMNLMMTPEALAALPQAQQTLYESTPTWVNIVYGIAVFSGTAGCIMLLIRKALTIPLLWISLAAVLIQMGYSLTMTNALEVYGNTGLIMPAIVIAIAIFLVWYAKKAHAKGMLG